MMSVLNDGTMSMMMMTTRTMATKMKQGVMLMMMVITMLMMMMMMMMLPPLLVGKTGEVKPGETLLVSVGCLTSQSSSCVACAL